uniref:Transcriptional regulator, LysR family n=1 Tax=Caulobacter sp. (strain K31) TaxID=366602 RepID=B0T922_CAUSK
MLSSSLRAFHEVVQCGSIRKASDKMGLAPSSVSRRVAMLERQIGTQLLERGATGITLTHAGRLVADFAGPAILNYDALCNDLNDLRGSRRQLIRVCTTASVAYMQPGETIARFRGKFDTVTFRFSSLTTEESIRVIKAGSYDIGISLRTAPDPEIEVVARIPEPTVLVVRRDHPLAGRTQVTLDEVAALPLAMLDDQYAIRRDFDLECRNSGLSSNILVESTTLLMLTDFVRSGLGATLMPQRTVTDPSLVSIPVDREVFRGNTIDLIVLRNRRLPRMVRLFLQALSDDMARSAREAVLAVA